MSEAAPNTRKRDRYVAGGLAVAFARIASQLTQLVVFVFGARVLGPEDFGIFALVSAVAMLAGLAAKAGSRGYILSCRGDRQVIREALMIAGMLGLAVAAVGVITALLLQHLAPHGGVPLLVALFAVWVPFAASSDAQLAVLVRDGRLLAAAGCDAIGEVVGAGVAISMLYAGFGAAALVSGRIAAQALQLMGGLALSKTLPTLGVTRTVVDELLEFSRHVLSVGLLANVRMSVATFVIGGSLGAASVGLFRAAQRLTGALFELLTEPMRVVGWVLFRRIGEPHGDFNGPAATADRQRAMEWIVPLIIGIAAPIYVGVAVMSEQILAVLLGEAWRPAAPLVSILAIASLLLTPSALSEPLLGLTGKMSSLPRISLFNAVVALALIVPAAQFDVLTVAWAQFASGCVALGTTVWLHERVLGVSWRRIAVKSVFLLPVLLTMTVLAVFVRTKAAAYGLAPLASLVVTALPAAVLYLAGVALLRAEALPQVWRTLRRA